MRILLLSDRIPPENNGGAEKIAWALAKGLRQAGHDVHVIAATPHPDFEDVRDGIPTYHVQSRFPSRLRYWFAVYNPQTIRKLRRLYQRIQPDVINTHLIHLDLSYGCIWLAHQMKIPVVFNAHDMMTVAYGKLNHFTHPDTCAVAPQDYQLPPFYNLRHHGFRYNPFRNVAIRYILKHFTQARLALSKAHQTALVANGLPSFQIVPNGLDPRCFVAPPRTTLQALQAQWGLAGRKIILVGGRLSAAKGSEKLLAAMNEVVQRVPEACLLVLSRQPITDAALADYPHLTSHHIKHAGWLDGEALAAAYHLAQVVTFPSIYLDAFGMMNLEAMAARKPLVSTCFGGAPEIVLDGETGYIVNPFQTHTFAERLVTLLQDEAQRNKLGEAGYKRLHDHFLLEQQVERHVAVYQAVMDVPPA